MKSQIQTLVEYIKKEGSCFRGEVIEEGQRLFPSWREATIERELRGRKDITRLRDGDSITDVVIGYKYKI